jgi:hypothetical protein
MEWLRVRRAVVALASPLREGMLAMLQHAILVIFMAAATTITFGGCRSCSSCHDYDPPVANCDCNSCGCNRAGSASGGYESQGYASGEYEVAPLMEESATEEPAQMPQ